MSLNDQFEHGRIPLKPLPYSNKELSQCNEIMIDYGENGTYHIYIVHHSDPTKYIDITSLIIKEMLPKAEINANQFTITIEGSDNPVSLQDIINFIYKRFEYADDKSGFIFDRDKDKLFDPSTKTIILRTTDGTYQLPVTTADNVYDKDGNSIQDRLDQMTRLGFDTSYITATENNQKEFNFNYPFKNYSDYMEVRVGTTYVDKSRYVITKIYEGNTTNYSTAKLTFLDESIEKGRTITIFWMYNSYNISNENINHTSGSVIADRSITIDKLQKASNSFVLDDSSSVATSKAVSDLYNNIINAIDSSNKHINYYLESEITAQNPTNIMIKIPSSVDVDDYLEGITNNGGLLTIALSYEHGSSGFDHGLSVSIYNGHDTRRMFLYMPDKVTMIRTLRINKVIKLIIDYNRNNDITGRDFKNKAILINQSGALNKPTKYTYTCIDQETEISYEELNINNGDIMYVYRNGVRLFEDLDYSINEISKTITLFVRTEEGERIVFELIPTGGDN